jgi:hypothetical protein
MMRPALVALCLLAATLAGVLIWEMQPAGPAPHSAARASQLQPAHKAGSGAADLTPARVATILRRPLFSPARRPPDAAVARAAGTGDGLPRLSAILISHAGKTVIFAPNDGVHPIVAQEGSHIGDFIVQSIGEDGVTMIGPGGKRVLQPRFSNLPSAGLGRSAMVAASAMRPSK